MRIAVAGATGTVGRHVVTTAEGAGHEVVPLSRRAGVDLTTGEGLADLLAGVDVVIDVTSTSTQDGEVSRTFFRAVTRSLLAAERAAGVGHHVALSIVGIEHAPDGYYAGKLLQERLLAEGSVPWTVLRATQFHEFAGQILDAAKLGSVRLTPRMVSQPVAAREVAERLVRLAEGAPVGRARDLAGPEVLRMPDLVRRYAAAVGAGGPIVTIPLPGSMGRAMRDGSLLATADADLGTQTFDAWLEGVRSGTTSR